MNYSKIVYYDTANCHGFSTTIWVSGCDRKCKNCFNPQLWDKNYGKNFDEVALNKVLQTLKNPFINNLVILGGEPMMDYNKVDVINLCKAAKEFRPDLKIIIYTGKSFEELNLTQEESQYIDYIIDGEFQENNKPKETQLRGSLNQKCWKRGDLGWFDFSEEYFKE